MGNVVAAAKAKGVELKAPKEKEEIENKIKEAEFQPSEGLKDLWLTVESGYFSNDWLVYIPKPLTIKLFKKDEECDGFAGFKKVEGLKAYHVITIWSDTDSRTPIFEMLEGEEKGKLVCFPFSDSAMYHSGKTTSDLIKEIEEKLKWEDPDDDMQTLLDTFFPPETRDNSPREELE